MIDLQPTPSFDSSDDSDDPEPLSLNPVVPIREGIEIEQHQTLASPETIQQITETVKALIALADVPIPLYQRTIFENRITLAAKVEGAKSKIVLRERSFLGDDGLKIASTAKGDASLRKMYKEIEGDTIVGVTFFSDRGIDSHRPFESYGVHRSGDTYNVTETFLTYDSDGRRSVVNTSLDEVAAGALLRKIKSIEL